jgi:hypothetical protein
MILSTSQILDFNMAGPERPQTLPQDFDSAHGVLYQFYVPILQAWMAELCPNKAKKKRKNWE